MKGLDSELPKINPLVYAGMISLEPGFGEVIPMQIREMAMSYALLRALGTLPIIQTNQDILLGLTIDQTVSDIFRMQETKWDNEFNTGIYGINPYRKSVPGQISEYFNSLNSNMVKEHWKRILMADLAGINSEQIRNLANPLLLAIGRRLTAIRGWSNIERSVYRIVTNDPFQGVARVDFKLEVPFLAGNSKVKA